MVTLDTFIGELGAAIGIPGLALDAEGQCQLALDGVVVDLLGDRRDGRLMLSCLVGELPDEGRAAVMARLLAANCLFRGTGGATYGVPEGSGAVVLARSVVPGHETGASLAVILVALADAAAAGRALLTPPPADVAASEGDTLLIRA